MIRLATESDIPRLVEMGQRFMRESSYHGLLADNPEKLSSLAALLISRDGLLISEKDGKPTGMIGFLMHEHFMSGELTCGEVFWWVEPEHRGDGIRLLREVEKRAIAAGAKHVQMSAPNESVANLYRHRGYGFVESTYQRAL